MASWPVGETVKTKAMQVLGWLDEDGYQYTCSWMGDDSIYWAVALGVKPGGSFMSPKSGVRFVCCADRNKARMKAKQLGGTPVFGWMSEWLEKQIDGKAE